ncbi:LysR family transcriptional regulator [Inhella gelatinilytica]|uniref:LysR family transcriptional regulator n=1 Tax=Inhella gelatinilytica TaxID=2795030 RepID=A0A931J120_9BURK|nr:LysR family transcriptional regulator [Inhella gelatinilytica]MBH9554188.1 LysR family transcriptional regulator [Inhella gelatinilytica]
MAPLPRFDWSLIPSFLAVLETGSMMGAARALQCPQPTVSRRIGQLEGQLGVALFERTGRGVRPTAAALALAESAHQMALGADQLAQLLARRSVDTRGTVRISASHVVASGWLPRVLCALHEAEPSLQIELVATNEVSNLLRREADIALRLLRPQQQGLIAKKLGDVRLLACAHRRYLARTSTPQDAADLLQHSLVGYDQNDAIVRGFAATGHAVSRENFAFRTDDHVAYAQLVRAGVGIGFLPDFLIRDDPDLVALLPELPTPTLPLWLVVHREIRGTPAVRRVFDFLSTQLSFVTPL